MIKKPKAPFVRDHFSSWKHGADIERSLRAPHQTDRPALPRSIVPKPSDPQLPVLRTRSTVRERELAAWRPTLTVDPFFEIKISTEGARLHPAHSTRTCQAHALCLF